MLLPLRNISAVDRVVPENKKQRGLLLLPTSQLFRLQLREVKSKKSPSELFFATFEPQTQLFFQLSRAVRIDFQKQLIPQLQFPDSLPARTEQRLELASLLEMLALDLVRARDDIERIHLLDELTAAAYSSVELKQLFFEDRTQVQGSTGLAAFLVRQLSCPLRPGNGDETKVEFILSVVRVLDAMCFDMQLQTSCLDRLSVNELAGNLLARGAESYTVGDKSADGSVDMHTRVLREDLMDAEAALLLSLDGIQQYEDFRLHQHQQMRGLLVERSTSVMQHALRSPALSVWLPKFFKRVCVAISRAAIAVEIQHEVEGSEIEEREGNLDQEDETDEEEDESDRSEALDPLQMLSLWRSVTVLELLVKSDVAMGSDQVLGQLLRTRKDYIDMYLRAPRFLKALSTSGIPHLEDVALKLARFLESLRERPRGR
ncbi:WD40 repeat-containing protein [Phytophthora cinnamomi]|uniref:WD40 repeat-containing protein n=1 Tax=Phytophthora cinnamomi TaxID=4785 RepID=UPI003559CCF6|nr:WD40 repeat-containing protein [Phytophthora cinnamomi]